jgi:rhomboid protease GluP
MCPQCRAFITTDDKVCPYCNNEVGKRAVETRSTSDALGGLIPQAQFTTVVILLINTGLYVATLLWSQRKGGSGGFSFDPDGQTLLDFGGKWPRAIAVGQWWRLITAGFLHGGILHILMNSWALFNVGSQAEESFGASRFLVIYVVSTVTGYLASFYGSPSLSVGASAGIFGLIGAMIAFSIREGTSQGAAMRSFYIQWAVYGLVMGFMISLIDNFAHIGGLAGGFLIGYIAATPRRIGAPGAAAMERMWQLAAVFTLVITAVAFFDMFSGLLRG